MALYISESFVNATDGHRFGDTPVYETWTDDPGKLYRSLVREYGRCTGKVYVDREGRPLPVGWVFIKRVQYEDCNDTYLREVWVTLHDSEETRTVEYHYHALAS